MTHPMPNTSSSGSSGCSQVDRFSKRFEKCRNREDHVKASVFFPNREGRVKASVFLSWGEEIAAVEVL